MKEGSELLRGLRCRHRQTRKRSVFGTRNLISTVHDFGQTQETTTEICTLPHRKEKKINTQHTKK